MPLAIKVAKGMLNQCMGLAQAEIDVGLLGVQVAGVGPHQLGREGQTGSLIIRDRMSMVPSCRSGSHGTKHLLSKNPARLEFLKMWESCMLPAQLVLTWLNMPWWSTTACRTTEWNPMWL